MIRNFESIVQRRMARTGETYRQACRAIGGAGGRKAAENKRRRAGQADKFHAEQQRQVAMGLREKDELPEDANFTAQDRINIIAQVRRGF